MKRLIGLLVLVVGLFWCIPSWCGAEAGAPPGHWLVTEWGSVLHNFQKVADRKYEAPEQIAGTADHYYVSTHDGSVYRDGLKIENQVHKNENVTDLAAQGDDYYLLTLQGTLYKNGTVLMAPGKVDRPIAVVLSGSDIWLMNDSGNVFKNGAPFGDRYYIKGYYPEHFAVSGNDLFFTISSGTAGGGGKYIYKNLEQANDETWLVRSMAVSGGDLYIFSGYSIFRNYERIAKYEPEKNNTGHDDNTIDFRFAQ